MPTTLSTTLRALLLVSLALLAALSAPAAASASTTQLSLLQDDREFLGSNSENLDAANDELRNLGVDVLRTNLIFSKVYRTPKDRKRPSGFDASNPDDPHYDWSATDQLVRRAHANGIRVLLTVTGPGPYFSSESPSRCRSLPCTYKPRVSDFAAFAAAAAKRYRGQADYYAIWNEPNIGKTWLTPRFATRKGVGTIDFAAARYRQLYIAGQKAIAKYDPARANRVLFGETAAIGSPADFLRAALCLDKSGKPFRGALARAQGCSGKVQKLTTLGFAHHPYNQGGNGTPRSKTSSANALPLAYVPRLVRLIDGAAKRGRVARGRGIYVTEFGFQTRPPDSFSNVSPAEQAQYINETDRLMYGSSRVKWVGQYELNDVPTSNQFQTGIRYVGGKLKPAYAAYRMPIVVTRLTADRVEVYGQVRPGGVSTVAIQAVSATDKKYRTVRTLKTGPQGMFLVRIKLKNAFKHKWRLSTLSPETGSSITSRQAKAGRPLRFYKG